MKYPGGWGIVTDWLVIASVVGRKWGFEVFLLE